MTKVKSKEAVFENGDKLVLQLVKGAKYVNLNEGDVIEVFYGERNEGEYGDDEPQEGKHHFMVTGLEYFSALDFALANSAFEERLSGKPEKATGKGSQLHEILGYKS